MVEKFIVSRDDAPKGHIRGYSLRESDFALEGGMPSHEEKR